MSSEVGSQALVASLRAIAAQDLRLLAYYNDQFRKWTVDRSKLVDQIRQLDQVKARLEADIARREQQLVILRQEHVSQLQTLQNQHFKEKQQLLSNQLKSEQELKSRLMAITQERINIENSLSNCRAQVTQLSNEMTSLAQRERDVVQRGDTISLEFGKRLKDSQASLLLAEQQIQSQASQFLLAEQQCTLAQSSLERQLNSLTSTRNTLQTQVLALQAQILQADVTAKRIQSEEAALVQRSKDLVEVQKAIEREQAALSRRSKDLEQVQEKHEREKKIDQEETKRQLDESKLKLDAALNQIAQLKETLAQFEVAKTQLQETRAQLEVAKNETARQRDEAVQSEQQMRELSNANNLKIYDELKNSTLLENSLSACGTQAMELQKRLNELKKASVANAANLSVAQSAAENCQVELTKWKDKYKKLVKNAALWLKSEQEAKQNALACESKFNMGQDEFNRCDLSRKTLREDVEKLTATQTATQTTLRAEISASKLKCLEQAKQTANCQWAYDSIYFGLLSSILASLSSLSWGLLNLISSIEKYELIRQQISENTLTTDPLFVQLNAAANTIEHWAPITNKLDSGKSLRLPSEGECKPYDSELYLLPQKQLQAKFDEFVKEIRKSWEPIKKELDVFSEKHSENEPPPTKVANTEEIYKIINRSNTLYDILSDFIKAGILNERVSPSFKSREEQIDLAFTLSKTPSTRRMPSDTESTPSISSGGPTPATSPTASPISKKGGSFYPQTCITRLRNFPRFRVQLR